MLRFLFSGLCMVGALTVLLAGATGDLGSLPRFTDWWDSLVARTLPALPAPAAPEAPRPPRPAPAAAIPSVPAPPVANTPPAPDTIEVAKARAARDALQQQVSALQSQVEQRAREAASVTADRDRLRQELDAVHQQRQAAAAAPQPAAPQPAAPAAPAAARPPAPPARPQPARVAPQIIYTPGPEAGPTSRERLVSAQQALVSGRAEDARQMLAVAQRQMAFSPVTADHPDVDGTNWPATWVGRAIHSLDAGDMPGALHDIALAIDSS